MADLLSASLDGAGELRSIHPSAYLARVASQDSEPLDPERARGWADRLGAELYVLGDVVATSDQVHISAVMYQRGRNDPVGQSSVAGSTADLFQLVDRLAAELIASRYGRPHERLTRVAAVTTASLPAFKSYLDGENAYREGRYAEAIEALTQAVTTDSTFALGYYRLSDAADRAGRAELAQRSAEEALRYRNRLGERERRLIEVQHSLATGAARARLRAWAGVWWPIIRTTSTRGSSSRRSWCTAIRSGAAPRSRLGRPWSRCSPATRITERR